MKWEHFTLKNTIQGDVILQITWKAEMCEEKLGCITCNLTDKNVLEQWYTIHYWTLVLEEMLVDYSQL